MSSGITGISVGSTVGTTGGTISAALQKKAGKQQEVIVGEILDGVEEADKAIRGSKGSTGVQVNVTA